MLVEKAWTLAGKTLLQNVVASAFLPLPPSDPLSSANISLLFYAKYVELRDE